MKKLLGILVLGLLLSSNAFAKEIKVYHKDENSISTTSYFWGTGKKQQVIASKHCAQYGKFAFDFRFGDTGPLTEKGKKTRQYHCSKSNLTKSPITGEPIMWTNYDRNHEFTQKKLEDKKSSIEEFKQICTDIGLTLGTSEFVDCVLKLKSDEEKMIMESQRLETEENIAKEKQKTAKDKQGLEQEKYDDEERERKQKKYEECLEETSKLYGEPKLFRCSLELL